MKNRVGSWLTLGAIAAGLSLLFVWRNQRVVPEEVAAPLPIAANETVEAASAPRENIASVTSNDPRSARVLVAGSELHVTPNARGEYQRLIVAPATSIEASVPFPDAPPGEVISVQSEDGGLLLRDAAEGRVRTDARRRANVNFSVSSGDGLHRVTLRRGSERRVLEFWVGEEPPVFVRR